MTGLPHLIALSDVASADPDLIGGKARGFAVLREAGLPVPEGFVPTADGPSGGPGRLGRIPGPVAEEGRPAGPRDGRGAPRRQVVRVRRGRRGPPHAGQYLTRLGVRGERHEALEAVLECWEVGRSDARAAAYRAHRGQDDAVRMAVIVQRLAHGEAAGVRTSCDPVTGDPGTTVVNASWVWARWS